MYSNPGQVWPQFIPTYNRLNITGAISVQPVERVPQDAFRWLIMGPTGSGKSSFIEALSDRSQNLGISKNQLESYTQRVRAYQLINVLQADLPVYLIDTPGFADTKISELEIMDMVRTWLRDNDISRIHRLLFLTPINETRLAGTKRRTIEMLRTLLSSPQYPRDLASVILVTTMWDTLHNERTRLRAVSNFAQLQNVVFKGFIDSGASIAQFTNTRQSALQILDTEHVSCGAFVRHISTISTYVYQDLHERVAGGLQQKQMIDGDLSGQEAQNNVELRTILMKNQKENDKILRKFIRQFIDFAKPPAGFEDTHKDLMGHILSVYRTQIFYTHTKETYFSSDDLCFEQMERRLMYPDLPLDFDEESEPVVTTTPVQKSTSAVLRPVRRPYHEDHLPVVGVVRSKSLMGSVKGTLRRLGFGAKGGGDKSTD